MSKQAAAAIRHAIKSGAYTGWLGIRDSTYNDYFMCIALSKIKPDGWEEARDAIDRKLSHLYDPMLVDELRAVYGPAEIPAPRIRCAKTRQIALDWFEALATDLEQLS